MCVAQKIMNPLSPFGRPPLPLKLWRHLWTAPYLHAEKGKDEDEEEEEEEKGEDGRDGVRQSQHQVSQARPVPDIIMCKCVIACSKCQNRLCR